MNFKVKDSSGYFDSAEYSRDTWITSRIKAKTIINRDIKFVNYNIITSKGVVYILGIARTQEELDKVANISASIAGVKRVVVQARVRE
jgi:osmotically-inducible protein OsmY